MPLRPPPVSRSQEILTFARFIPWLPNFRRASGCGDGQSSSLQVGPLMCGCRGIVRTSSPTNLSPLPGKAGPLCQSAFKFDPRIASPRMLLDNFSPMTGTAPPNRFGVLYGGKDQHGRGAWGGGGGGGAVPG